MRDEYDKFEGRGVVILALGPNPPAAFEQYWRQERIPFTGLPDPDHWVARLYKQEVKVFRLGRMPLNCVVDGNGYIRYAHYGNSMRDIPSNEELLQVIDELIATSN